MTGLFWHRTTAVWAALVAITCLSWALGTSHGLGPGGLSAATAAVLALAFLKVRYVGLEFMELRHADPVLRLAFEAWVVLVGGTVVGVYLLA